MNSLHFMVARLKFIVLIQSDKTSSSVPQISAIFAEVTRITLYDQTICFHDYKSLYGLSNLQFQMT